jgi:hypothetical protein
MSRTSRRWSPTPCLPAAALGVAAVLTPIAARADDTIRHPGEHAHYSVEIEPHVIASWADEWDGTGFGLGGRVSINLTHDGFVRTINNSVAIGLGLDWVHYSGTGCFYDPRYPNDCYGYGYYASADFFQIPVVGQWNFYVAQRWSVFGELGIYFYHGLYGAPSYPCNGPGLPACGYYTNFHGADSGIGPALWLGGRYHLSDTMALTLRLGFPDILTLGVSFLP